MGAGGCHHAVTAPRFTLRSLSWGDMLRASRTTLCPGPCWASRAAEFQGDLDNITGLERRSSQGSADCHRWHGPRLRFLPGGSLGTFQPSASGRFSETPAFLQRTWEGRAQHPVPSFQIHHLRDSPSEAFSATTTDSPRAWSRPEALGNLCPQEQPSTLDRKELVDK